MKHPLTNASVVVLNVFQLFILLNKYVYTHLYDVKMTSRYNLLWILREMLQKLLECSLPGENKTYSSAIT